MPLLQLSRLETGAYDHVIAIEMVEAVGEKFLPTFFQCVHDRLKPGGTAALQVGFFLESHFSGHHLS